MRVRWDWGEVFRAYAITMFFLFGVHIVYTVFQSPGDALKPIVAYSAQLPFWIYMPPVWIVFFFFSPFLVFLLPYQSSHSYLVAVAAPVGFYFSWWLVWYLMYGRRR